MTKSIAITRTDYTAAELRELAAGSDDGAQVRRLSALALTLEGGSWTQAAEQCGMQRQTLRDWVHRYNAEGIAGLITRGGPGQPPALNEQQMAELKEVAIKGPDPEKHCCATIKVRIPDNQDENVVAVLVPAGRAKPDLMCRHRNDLRESSLGVLDRQ